MAYQAWICESCESHWASYRRIEDCPGCGKDVCDSCGSKFGHCKPCSEGKTDEELRVAANAAGFDFEPDDWSASPAQAGP